MLIFIKILFLRKNRKYLNIYDEQDAKFLNFQYKEFSIYSQRI